MRVFTDRPQPADKGVLGRGVVMHPRHIARGETGRGDLPDLPDVEEFVEVRPTVYGFPRTYLLKLSEKSG